MSEQRVDVGHKSDVQINWEQNSPINDGLRKIVEPLADHFTQQMENELAVTSYNRRQEMLRTAGNVYTLPYGRIGMLPPALFGDINEQMATPRRDLSVPREDAAIASMVRDYSTWAWGIAKSRKGILGSRYSWSAFPGEELITKKLTEFKGMSYPVEQWQASAQQMQCALRDEPLFIMDDHRRNRMNNAAYDYDQLNDATKRTHRQHQSYVLVMSQVGPKDGSIQGTRDHVQLPIGEYGEEAAAKLARLTIFMSDFIKDSSMIDVGVRTRLTVQDEALLREYTARSRERYADSVTDYAVHGVKNTLTEGILSIAQTISFLTAKKVPGYEDYNQLVRAILDSDVIEQFTRSVRPGYIGPVTLSGLYMPGALVECNGKLALNKYTLSVLSEPRKEHITRTAAQWAAYKASGGTTEKPMALGLVCPAAAPGGGDYAG